MVTINRYIKALLHPAGGHEGSHKAHQAGKKHIPVNPITGGSAYHKRYKPNVLCSKNDQ